MSAVNAIGPVVVVGTPVRAVGVNQACPATPFLAGYRGVRVECVTPGEDYAAGRTVPVRGTVKAAVPADVVTERLGS